MAAAAAAAPINVVAPAAVVVNCSEVVTNDWKLSVGDKMQVLAASCCLDVLLFGCCSSM